MGGLPRELANTLFHQGLASDIKLDALPLVKNSETSHTLITGTTGSGKTNCFHTLLPQIRKRGDSSIVIDTTGDLISRYYREGRDLILNPLDERSQKWDLWEECLTAEELENFAEAFIPHKGKGHDPFWEIASRKILTTAIDMTKENRDMNELYHLLACSNIRTYHDFFEGTAAATFTDKEGGKTTISVRSNLVAQIACFEYLNNDSKEGFSIRKWLKTDPKDQWLFITSTTTQRQLLRPLMSAWVNTAVNSLMALEPDNTRRLWLVVDELPSLNNVPSLKTALAEFRKYGGCILVGLQSFPQLAEVYGDLVSKAMLDLFNTKIMFRTTDPSTSEWVSKVIGEVEYAESQENLSFGANSIRDGVSLGRAEKIKKTVLQSEVSLLRNLECYVKYPGDYPAARILMTYKNIFKTSLPFIEKLRVLEVSNETEAEKVTDVPIINISS